MRFIFVILIMPMLVFSIQKPSMRELENKIDSILSTQAGVFAIALKDCQTGKTLFRNEKEMFHAASTMKLPVMVEVFNQCEKGYFSLTDSLTVKNTFYSIIDGSTYSLGLTEDSEDGLYSSIGKKESIISLVFKMITVSSNLATNILIEKVTARNVIATMRLLGAKDIQVLRGVEDTKAFNEGKNNTTTAYDLMLLCEKISTKSILSEKSCDQMLEILFNQKFNDMIPAKLPQDVRIAHKTGSITGVQHDAGIIYLPDGKHYILVILSKNLISARDGIETIAEISKLIYNFQSK